MCLEDLSKYGVCSKDQGKNIKSKTIKNALAKRFKKQNPTTKTYNYTSSQNWQKASENLFNLKLFKNYL